MQIATNSAVSQALITDLSIQTARAAYLYHNCDLVGAYSITKKIMEESGLFQDCLAIHVVVLAQLHKSDDLFILGHHLVDTQPDNEISWYTPKQFFFDYLDKCTTMNGSFGEGWLAFGHALSAESEHEQAMNCFLRASRVLEGCFEPMMYIGLEYAYANNTKLAQDFLKDAAEIAGENALVLHEEGCICFMKKEWKNAETFFTKALLSVFGVTDESVSVCDLLSRPISDFWEPLVNNLGHVKRKLGLFEEAKKFHQKSLTMCPTKSNGISGLALATACSGDIDRAIWYFHKALGFSPHNSVISYSVLKQGLQKLLDLIETYACYVTRKIELPAPFTMALSNFDITAADLEMNDEEKQAHEKAMEVLRQKRQKRTRKDSKGKKTTTGSSQSMQGASGSRQTAQGTPGPQQAAQEAAVQDVEMALD
ncbi:unnamed protein product [Gongylonema pulchrum]|uniref:TPR_REGION domain-containing protein n=1 Tax=Gongylonema pulchrum TaxID=637853 RepID=A0A183CZC3_9BILA|nr:unnamed protein product [Gongylonema pulchrum]